MISAIVLAAGESRRMGQTKQLLKLGPKTLLQHVLDNLLGSRVNEIILVLGHDVERILREVETGKVKVVINPAFKEGMITSIQKGLQALDERAEAFFVVLGDQPGIPSAIFDRLIEEFKKARPSRNIILAVYRGRRGHPALFGAKYIAEALQIKGDVGLQQILKEHPEDIRSVELGTDCILQDIDTPEDYRAYRHPGKREEK